MDKVFFRNTLAYLIMKRIDFRYTILKNLRQNKKNKKRGINEQRLNREILNNGRDRKEKRKRDKKRKLIACRKIKL